MEYLSKNGVSLTENTYYLEKDVEPWKWYWNLSIFLFSGLFFYRLMEAVINGFKKKKLKTNEN